MIAGAQTYISLRIFRHMLSNHLNKPIFLFYLNVKDLRGRVEYRHVLVFRKKYSNHLRY